jgi:hypothetical protein
MKHPNSEPILRLLETADFLCETKTMFNAESNPFTFIQFTSPLCLSVVVEVSATPKTMRQLAKFLIGSAKEAEAVAKKIQEQQNK